MASASVFLNIRPLEKFSAGIRREVTTGSNREDDLYTAWGRRYLAQLRDDFRRNRAGGGAWPPLAPATLKQGKARIGILDVTGAVFNALRPGQPGNLFQRTPTGMKVGVGGEAKHPDADATIAQVAVWHNDGAGNLPVRRIINPPDATTTAGIQKDARAALARIAKESSEPLRANR
jgi:hypothetical protein